MILRVYKAALSKGLNDNETVFAWFLTFVFRHLGETETLTMHRTDIQYILFGSTSVKFKVETVQEGLLAKAFVFMDLGDRIAIRLKEEVLQKRYANRKLGVSKTEIVEEPALRLAVYLHAAVNFIDNIVSTGDSPFEPMGEDTSRFATRAKNVYTIQDRFSVENMLGDPLGKRNKKGTDEYLFKR